MTRHVGVDFETYSPVPLGGVNGEGVPRYVASPDFKVLCVSVSVPYVGEFTYDFVFNCMRYTHQGDRESAPLASAKRAFKAFLRDYESHTLIAQNAGFERAVTESLFPGFDPDRFEDSAVDAAIAGAGRSLEAASRQLTRTSKLESGKDLIQLFCVPNKHYPEGPTASLIKANGHMEQWLEFIHYCEVDAKAGLEIRRTVSSLLDEFDPDLLAREVENERITHSMNKVGWGVDIELVEKMKQRAWANRIIAKRQFQVEDSDGNPVEVNFNSHQQLRKFCEERGVKYKSLDKYHLPVVLKRVKDRIANLEKELDGEYPHIRRELGRLKDVESLLETKAEIGGSALTKLPTILRLVSEDNILRDQYMHVGAGQTFRTSGRGVQMQNLKKLDGEIKDVSTLYDFNTHWSNGDMAGQLRQVFTSRHPEGKIIVGDFAGVESRGLAYEAGEEWKLDTFRKGLDVYKVLVTRFIPGLKYEEVTDELRPRGKYSELSCGYQASGKAVQDFMFRLGFSITLGDALQNVQDWRKACPAIVDYWGTLDNLLKDAVHGGMTLQASIGNGLSVRVSPFSLPSIEAIHPGALSLCIQILVDGEPYVTRFVHGCYFRENRLCYYKPVERLGGKGLWTTIDETRSAKLSAEAGEPVTAYFSIYGGKLAGILTQSLCRELFFDSARELKRLFEHHGVTNAVMCGQFHDEINVDWTPGEHSEEFVMTLVRQAMKTVRVLRNFPLDVEVKSATRYIK